jgi:hypothetical protein
MMQKSATRAYGTYNVWDLYDLEESKRIPLEDHQVDVFLHLLFTSSSEKVAVMRGNTQLGWVGLRLWGPMTDDAIYYQPEVKGALPEFEKHRLHTDFTLWRVSIRNYLPLEEDRDNFVARLHELGVEEELLAKTCKTLMLRRLEPERT